MSGDSSRLVTAWLLTICGLTVLMVVFGGYVRLMAAGLSIVEWDLISGVLPPIGQTAWQASFAQYQLTPEFQKVNFAMTLAEFRGIFYIEYFHRLLGRIAGLIVLLPLGFFLFKGMIPWRRSAIYTLIALLFVFQGFLGWYMVSSGLVDRPSVSPYRLTLHLLAALLVLALTLWTALHHVYGLRTAGSGVRAPRRWAILLLILLVVQLAYGGLMAGMKAGHISDTFPWMFGVLVPSGLLSTLQPWWANLVADPTTVHFVHRWLAFAVLLVAAILAAQLRSGRYPHVLRRGLLALILLVTLQIGLGVSVIWFHVPLLLALLHQLTAVLLLMAAIFLTFHLRLA